ncbi:MAG: nodulation protein NfeD [Anaerolineae bacterium]|nr:nodulation protein NfeD [Thermoflexus sp.]MDW8064367.1 nodulation protein NfeD [Anaerolineae bacterium]
MRSVLRFGSILWLVAWGSWAHGAQEAATRKVLWLRVEGALTPVVADYLKRGIEIAQDQGIEAVVVQLNTPGGEVQLTLRLVSMIRESPVPIVVYVAPRGAIAGSAGTLVTLAGHFAWMAPETAIGAASPVGDQGEDLPETINRKVKEILKAQIRGLAERRGPDAVRLAEAAVESAKAVSAQEAQAAGLVDGIAHNLEDLLQQLDGRTVSVQNQLMTLRTRGAVIVPLPMSIVEEILHRLVNPNIALILLAVGVQAILIELSNPGGWVAGFIGVVCLLLAAYGIGMLPVNWLGLLLMAVAIVLFILDIKAPTHGALTAVGAVTFIAGALVLFAPVAKSPFPPLSLWVAGGTGLGMAGFFGFIVAKALQAQRRRSIIGVEALIGRVGEARTDLHPVGMVQVAGELWTAESEAGMIAAGTPVQIVGVEGLRLKVRKWTPSAS